MVFELVARRAQVGDAQDHELGLAAGEDAAGHESPCEPEPAPEQLAMAPERQEEIERRGARDQPGGPAQNPREDADVASPAGSYPRRAHSRACGVVSGA